MTYMIFFYTLYTIKLYFKWLIININITTGKLIQIISFMY